MTNHRLRAYLEMERQMLALDRVGDPLADVLREAMDPLWYGLSDEEHSLLDARTISAGTGAALKAPVGSSLYLSPPHVDRTERRTEPLRVADWRCAA